MEKGAKTTPKSLILIAALPVWLAAAQGFAAEVKDGVVCTAVADRSCSGAATEFSTGVGKVLAFTRIVGMKYGDIVTHRWIYQDQVMREIQLTIGGPDWRTWSSKNMDPLWAGAWKVEVVDDATGTVLTTLHFTIR